MKRLYQLQGTRMQRRAAVHEAGHAVADLWIGVPIGEEGVRIDEHGGIGFTDSRPTEVWVQMKVAHPKWIDYALTMMSGPFAEARYLLAAGLLDEALEGLWSSSRGDFAEVMGGHNARGILEFTRLCFELWLTPDNLSGLEGVDPDTLRRVRQWVEATNEFLDTHMPQVMDLAGRVLDSPGLQLSGQQVREWWLSEKGKTQSERSSG